MIINSPKYYNDLYTKNPDRWGDIGKCLREVAGYITDTCNEDRVYHIIDLGCGTGTIFKLLNDSRYNIYAIDQSSVAINIAKKRFPSIHFQIGDMSTTTFDDKSFDVVMSIGSFEHLPQISFDEQRRIIKDNGHVLNVLPTDNSGELHLVDTIDQQEWCGRRDVWIPVIEKSNFKVDNLDDMNYTHQWIFTGVPI